MKLTDTIHVTASTTDYQVNQDDQVIYLQPAGAIALALSLAKWATNPDSIAGQGVDELREVAATLTTEADYRESRR